jgi:CDP-diglyceride synthetase
MYKLFQIAMRLLPAPAFSIIFGGVHVLESRIEIDGLTQATIFITVLYLIILAKKAILENQRSAHAIKSLMYLHYIEVGMGVFSLITIMLGYYLSHQSAPHDPLYYYGYFSNFFIFISFEGLSRIKSPRSPGKDGSDTDPEKHKKLTKPVKPVYVSKKTIRKPSKTTKLPDPRRAARRGSG